MNAAQKNGVRRRLERAHKDVVIDLCLRLMEANNSLTRQLAHYLIRRPCAVKKDTTSRADETSPHRAFDAPGDPARDARPPCRDEPHSSGASPWGPLSCRMAAP